MKELVLTGAPGAGKTAIIRQLEIDSLSVVEEAATDVITLEQARGVAEPWTQASFIDSIANLQRLRLRCASNEPGYLQFHDRSAVCTAALAVNLGHPVSATLRVNWSASRQMLSLRSLSSLSAILARSRRPKHGKSASRKPYVLNGSMRRTIVTSALTWSSSNQRPCQNGWLRSKQRSMPFTLGPGDHRASASCGRKPSKPSPIHRSTG